MSDTTPTDAQAPDPVQSEAEYEQFRAEREAETSPAAVPADTPPDSSPADDGAGAPGEAAAAAGDERDERGKFKKSDKPRDNPVARIKELTAKQRAAEERAAAAERRALELQAQIESTHKNEYEPTTRERPTIEQFKDEDDPYIAWQEALVDWKLEQRDAHHYRRTQEQAIQSRWQEHLSRVNEYKSEHPDWDQVISVPSTPLSAVMMTAIVESDRGPEIAYYLGSHPEVLDQLARESHDAPAGAAPLMRRYLETVISSPSSAAATTTGTARTARHSRAAAPPTPVGNGTPTARDESPDTEPVDQFVARRNAEEIKRRQLGRR